MDPIAERFAWATTYNYAENEPVGHIDLWGLQQINMAHARLWADTRQNKEHRAALRAGVEGRNNGVLGGAAVGMGFTATYRGLLWVFRDPARINALQNFLWETTTDQVAIGGRMVGAAVGGVAGSFSDDFVRGVNKSGGRANCSRCADAVIDRLKGNVNSTSVADEFIDSGGAGYFSEQVLKYGKPFSSEGLGGIANKLDELGDGTFGKVVVFGNGDNSGHAFVIAKLEGQVKILDGQSEQIIPRDQFAGWVNKNKAEKGESPQRVQVN